MVFTINHRGKAKRFTVQVLVTDQWITLDGAQDLPREEAQAVHAHESTIVGQQRVRMFPTTRKEAP